MPTITTYLGYKFHTDDDTIKVGQRVEVPIPVVENPVTVPQRVLDYLSPHTSRQGA